MQSIKKHGAPPFCIALLHGGPGAAGEMRSVAQELGRHGGVLELLQTAKTVQGQIEELHQQIVSAALLPVVVVGYSWGAWLGILFASRYPQTLKKLILIGAGAFESRYNQGLLATRLKRLSEPDKQETENLLAAIQAGEADHAALRRFGELMARADAYAPQPYAQAEVDVDMAIYQSVWPEAARLRDANELLAGAGNITCPVVAIHGAFDPHPLAGVEEPLAKVLRDFKMVRLDQCGHTPWLERDAKDAFYEILNDELQ